MPGRRRRQLPVAPRADAPLADDRSARAPGSLRRRRRRRCASLGRRRRGGAAPPPRPIARGVAPQRRGRRRARSRRPPPPVPDPALAASLRRLLTKDLLARRRRRRSRRRRNHELDAGSSLRRAAGRRSPACALGRMRARPPPVPRRRRRRCAGAGSRDAATASRRARTTTTPSPRCSAQRAGSRTPSRAARRPSSATRTRRLLWMQLAQWLARAERAGRGASRRPRRPSRWRPTRCPPHLTLAELYRRQRSSADAEARAGAGHRADPDVAGRLSRAGPAATSSRRRTTRRAAVLLRLVERQPKLAQAQFLLGRVAIETEQWDEAIAAPQARRRARSRPRRRVDGARLRVRDAQPAPKRRSRSTGRRVKANPDNPAFVERLGDLLVRLGRFKEAQTEVEALAEAAPRDPRVWMKLGAIYYEQKQWDRASVAPSAAPSRSSPTNLRARYFLATDATWTRARTPRRGSSWSDPRAPTRARSTRACSSASCTAAPSATTRRSRLLREAINLEPKRPELFLYLGTALLPGQAVRPGGRSAAGRSRASTTSRRTCTSSSGSSTRSSERFDDAVRAVPPRASRSTPSTPSPTTTSATCTPSAARTSTRPSQLIKQGARPRARERLLHRQPGLGLLPAGPLPRGAARAPARRRAAPRTIRSSSSTWATRYLKNGYDRGRHRRLGAGARSSTPTADGVKKKLEDAQDEPAPGSRVSARRPSRSSRPRRLLAARAGLPAAPSRLRRRPAQPIAAEAAARRRAARGSAGAAFSRPARPGRDPRSAGRQDAAPLRRAPAPRAPASSASRRCRPSARRCCSSPCDDEQRHALGGARPIAAFVGAGHPRCQPPLARPALEADDLVALLAGLRPRRSTTSRGRAAAARRCRAVAAARRRRRRAAHLARLRDRAGPAAADRRAGRSPRP